MVETNTQEEIYEHIVDIFNEEVTKKISNIFCDVCFGSFGRVSDASNTLRCTSKKCRKKISIFNSKPFFNSKLDWNKLCKVVYLIAYGYSAKQIHFLVDVNKRSIRRIAKSIGKLLPSDNRIGGENIIVEIDESKFGKRKYHRGHKVDGVWVLGMVERTDARKCIFIPVLKRNRQTLNSVIRVFVKENSIIYTDCWRGYNDLTLLGYTHLTVNHSKHFVDPLTKIHTNTIEGTWSALKRMFPARCRSLKSISRYLNLFSFCRMYNKDRFRMLIRYLLNKNLF